MRKIQRSGDRATLALSALFVSLLPACGGGGGGGGAASSSASPQPPGLGAGTRLTFISGETDQPVAGAAVTVAGKAYTTDSAGQIALADPVPLNATLDVTSLDFLDRRTLVRSATETRFTLWPKRSPTGLDEDYTIRMVYDDATCFTPAKPDAVMVRLAAPTTRVYVEMSPEIANDPGAGRFDLPARVAHEKGVAVLNAALHGGVTYVLTTQAPPNEVVMKVRVVGVSSSCPGGASFDPTPAGNFWTIGGGTVNYCEIESARQAFIVAHELGHSFGLGHSNDPNDIMVGGDCLGQSTRLLDSFSAKESLLMALMLQRSPGQRFPDDDRTAPTAPVGSTGSTSAAAATEGRIRRFVCRW